MPEDPTDPSAPHRPRVAIVSHCFFPSLGGSERFHEFGARALLGECDVRVMTADLNLPDPPHPPPCQDLAIEYLPSRRFFGERLVRPWRLWAALRRWDPKVIWTNQPSMTADLGGLFALLTGRRWVATYHADLSPRNWYAGLAASVEARLLRHAYAVEVTSPRYAQKLASRRIRSERLHVCVPGPYLGEGNPPPVPPRPRAGLLFVGALDVGHEYKRLDRLLETIARMRGRGIPVRLVVVGDGPLRPSFEAYAHRLGLGGGVVDFRGRLSDSALAECFATATALVLPADSDTEGFGSVAVEAAWYGCPSVVSSVVSVGDLLARYGCVARYDTSQPASFEAVLDRLVTDGAWAAELSANTASAARDLNWGRLLPAIIAPVRGALGLSTRDGVVSPDNAGGLGTRPG